MFSKMLISYTTAVRVGYDIEEKWENTIENSHESRLKKTNKCHRTLTIYYVIAWWIIFWNKVNTYA